MVGNGRFQRLSMVNDVEVIQTIVVTSIIGEGVEADPVRELVEVFTMDGTLIARHDRYRDTLETVIETKP